MQKLVDKERIVFRADGNAAMGLGHLFRSAALASMLGCEYAKILFYRDCPEKVISTLTRHFDRVVAVPKSIEELGSEQDVKMFLDYLVDQDTERTIVVLDGYHFKTDYQVGIIDAGFSVVCIDDIHDCHYPSDLVINHAPILNLADCYSASDKTGLAMGPAYALLRPAYLSAARSRPWKDEGQQPYLICFGGADVNNITGKVIDLLLEEGETTPLNIVLGGANQYRSEVMASIERYPAKVQLFNNLNDLDFIELYKESRLAILPASTTMMEALAVGIPVVGGYYVGNQEDIYAGFVAQNVIDGVGDWNEPVGLHKAIAGAKESSKVTVQPDGYSDVNLRQAFRSLLRGGLNLVPRLATKHDARQYFEWVNDRAVRESALTQHQIKWTEHKAWFLRRVHAQGSLLLVFESGRDLVGQVRVEHLDSETVIIDYSVHTLYRGKGIGREILELAAEQVRERLPSIKKIKAEVRLKNGASIRTFEKLEYPRIENRIVNDVELAVFEKGLFE
jgi:UDP-2,4-diacetamido-2,4,6-trideoxy-beta-L-altropyranose hydrolase